VRVVLVGLGLCRPEHLHDALADVGHLLVELVADLRDLRVEPCDLLAELRRRRRRALRRWFLGDRRGEVVEVGIQRFDRGLDLVDGRLDGGDTVA